MVGADAVADAYTVRYDDQDELALSATEVAKWLVLPSNKHKHTEARAKLARALDARAICSEEQATSQASHRREVSQALATAELMVSQHFYVWSSIRSCPCEVHSVYVTHVHGVSYREGCVDTYSESLVVEHHSADAASAKHGSLGI